MKEKITISLNAKGVALLVIMILCFAFSTGWLFGYGMREDVKFSSEEIESILEVKQVYDKAGNELFVTKDSKGKIVFGIEE